jgi:hypothetical protein
MLGKRPGRHGKPFVIGTGQCEDRFRIYRKDDALTPACDATHHLDRKGSFYIAWGLEGDQRIGLRLIDVRRGVSAA